jgi:hypothetical protein
MAGPWGPIWTSASHIYCSVISIRQIQKTKATIDSFYRPRSIQNHKDLFQLIWQPNVVKYWLVWPQGYDDYLEKNYSINFWGGLHVATTFFLGRLGLTLIDTNGAGAFGADSTITSTATSYRFFLRIAGGACSCSLLIYARKAPRILG